MGVRKIEGIVYRIKTTTGGFLVEVLREGSVMEDYDNAEKELACFCADLSMRGYIITSVTRVFDVYKVTPRVAVLTSKEYKSEINRLMKERKNESERK